MAAYRSRRWRVRAVAGAAVGAAALAAGVWAAGETGGFGPGVPVVELTTYPGRVSDFDPGGTLEPDRPDYALWADGMVIVRKRHAGVVHRLPAYHTRDLLQAVRDGAPAWEHATGHIPGAFPCGGATVLVVRERGVARSIWAFSLAGIGANPGCGGRGCPDALTIMSELGTLGSSWWLGPEIARVRWDDAPAMRAEALEAERTAAGGG